MYQLGWEQFVPFTATVVGFCYRFIGGITIGLLFGLFYTLRHSYRNSHHVKYVSTTEDGREVHHLVLAEEVSFFNKQVF